MATQFIIGINLSAVAGTIDEQLNYFSLQEVFSPPAKANPYKANKISNNERTLKFIPA